MKLLITNHWLKKWGGSETFTYTLIGEAIRQGHSVDVFTHQPGIVSDKIKQDFGVQLKVESNYDLILANHHTTVSWLKNNGIQGKIIQTCHGVIPKLEQPNPLADAYVSISEEVKRHLSNAGFKSLLIYNGIDCNRFKPTRDLNPTPKRILSMVFSEAANNEIQKACKALNIEFISFNKHKNPVFNVEKEINNSDLVIGLGRCVYEAMSCGRPVIVYDNRPYMPSYADGYLDEETLKESVKNNCSGRRFKRQFNSDDIITEIKKYNAKDGDLLRAIALKDFNITTKFQEYIMNRFNDL